MKIKLILFIISQINYCIANTSLVYKAFFSYEKPKRLKNNIEQEFKERINEDLLLLGSVSYRLLNKKDLVVPIKHKRVKLELRYNPDKISLNVKTDFL